MNIGNFLQKDNINMLWDVISDEDIFKFLTRDVQSKISQLFLNNINGFFETERNKTNNITDINKKYILLMLNHIKKNYPNQMPNKIKILDEPIKNGKELITYEEIQNDRASQFEKDLNRRQEEFTNAMTLKVPNVPEFSDNFADTPIKDMDKIIKEMTSKRNYEVEQINRNIQINGDKQDNWLKPQETSIKMEKFEKNANTKKNNLDSPKKSVTWGENDDTEVEDNIFKKLKKIEQPVNNISITFDESSTDDKITMLQTEVKTLNTKLDMIIKLLNNNLITNK
jgi:hypothetical protein